MPTTFFTTGAGPGVNVVTSVTASPPLSSSGGTTPNISLTGIVPVANGGTGDSSLTLDGVLYGNGTSPVGVTAAGLTGQVLIGNTGAAPSWAAVGTGTVTSVNVSGGTTGLTTSGGPITTSGTITISGTLDVFNGGTGDTAFTLDGVLFGNGTSPVGSTAAGTTGQVLTATTGSAPTWQSPATSGTVTSINVSGGTTGLTTSGGPVTSSGTITLAGILAVANGGTGVTTSTGTGSVVLSNSPTFVTPNLDTPSAVVLTHGTGLPLTTGVTGILPVANGGTGDSTLTLNGIVFGNGTSPAGITAAGTDGQLLTAATGGAPTWQTPTPTPPFGFIMEFYGNGTDGNVTISSGTTTLTRDMYYNNLTISGTGILKPVGFRIFVFGILDISAAPAGAIQVVGGVGSVGGGGGSVGPVNGGGAGAKAYTTAASSVGVPTGGGAGGTGNLNAGGAGTGSGGTSSYNGGQAGSAGAGGAGSVGTGGGAGGPVGANYQYIRRPTTEMIVGVTLWDGGSGGAGGGGAGGDNSVTYGSGGGGGGGPPGVLWIGAQTINRGASTAVGAIAAYGAAGGAGGAGGSANSGGGGGGSGAGGGWIYIIYSTLTGATATNCIDISGGAGGNGGNSGASAVGGNGGGSGFSGLLEIIDLTTAVLSETLPVTGANGSAHSGTTGGAGASTNTKQISL